MIYRFSGFEFDTERRELLRSGVVVAIPPKPLSVLEYLIERNHRMVPKSELLDAFWAVDVSEAALQTTIRVIRRALGPEAGRAAIRTHHGQGFRFVAALEEDEAAPQAEPDADPHAQAALREQRRVAVLSVRIGDEDADRCALDGLLDVARARIEADGGHLMHMMIDGFTAIFGLGADAEDGARRAVACAWDLMASGAAGAFARAPTCGVETGPVLVSDASDGDAWAPPGEVERQASALARAGAPGAILVGAATLRQLRDEIEVARRPEGWVLAAKPACRAGIVGGGLRLSRDFVGRAAELAFLASSAESVRSGTGQAVLLSGPAGIGKSRLVREFLARHGQGTRTVCVQCLPRLATTPLAPIRQLCAALCPAPPDARDLDPVDRALLSRLVDGGPASSSVLEGLSEHAIRDRSRALFVKLVAGRCAEAPLAIVVEDAHWIDPASRAHLSRLVREADALPLLLVVTSRPTDGVPLAERVLHLAPLGRSDCLALLATYAQTRRLSGQDAATLVDRCAGNPFFLEELALATRSAAAPAPDLPDSVQAVMEARVAGLDPPFRRLLYAIATIGPPAPVERVARLLGVVARRVAADVESLVRSGFLTEGEDGVAFRHMLLHDTAYAMIAPGDRIRMHGEVARLLEADAGAHLPETLAWHWQEAGETERALDCWAKASLAAQRRFAGPAAITFAERGLALVDPSRPDHAPRELRLQLCLAPALMARSGYGAEEVGRAFYRALDLSVATGSAKARVRALLGLWVHAWVVGRLGESLAHGRALLDIAGAAGDDALRLQGHGGIGAVLMHVGDLDGARRHLDAGLALVGAAPPDTITVQHAAVTCTAYAAWVAGLQGRQDAMRRHIARCAALAEALPNPFARAIHLALSANVLMSVGADEACLDQAERAVSLSRSQRYPFWLGTGLVLQGWALVRRGAVADGLAAIDEGIAVFEATGAGIQRANWFGIKAEALLAAGRHESGSAACAIALEAAERHGDTWFLARIRAVAARLCDAQGQTDAALRHAEAAEALRAAQGIVPGFIEIP